MLIKDTLRSFTLGATALCSMVGRVTENHSCKDSLPVCNADTISLPQNAVAAWPH